MKSQVEIYDDAAAHYDKEAAVIRQKAAKLRKKIRMGHQIDLEILYSPVLVKY